MEAIKQLYTSGMASSKPSDVPPAPTNNRRSFLDEEIEDEYLPKKAAAPEVMTAQFSALESVLPE